EGPSLASAAAAAAGADELSSSQASIQVTIASASFWNGAFLWEGHCLEEGNYLLLPVNAFVFFLQIHKWVAGLAVPYVWQTCFHSKTQFEQDGKRNLTLVHQPAHISSYRPMGWPSPMSPKYMAAPMSSRSKARFIPHIGNKVPLGIVRTASTYLCDTRPRSIY
ncbi:UDP-glucosyl transferase 71C2, partial [Striga asiatica]